MTRIRLALTLIAGFSGLLHAQETTPPLPAMVHITAAPFVMGREKTWPNELPLHSVQLRSFYLSRTEISFEQYDAFAQATKNDLPYDEGFGRGARPVINVSWNDAQHYVQWLSAQTGKPFRLPTEAEWEYAAHAGKDHDYDWGGFVDLNRANCRDCNSPFSGKQTAPVASFPANAYGLFDMHGNVWEWVEDAYHDTYAGAPVDGSAWTGNTSMRMMRGGSWADKAASMRASKRVALRANAQSDRLGFRVACDGDC